MKSAKMGFREKKKKEVCSWVREGKPDCEPRGVARVQRVDVDGHGDLPGVTRMPPPGWQELPSMQAASRDTGRMWCGTLWASQVVLVVKNPPANTGDARDAVSTPGLGRSPREGNGNPLQYSCLQNPMDRGAWHAIVLGVEKSQT